jgi:hypothetical protein
LRYQLIGQRRSFLWLTFTALVGLAALGMATILGVRFWYSLGLENGVTRWDYSALAMAVMSVVLGGWAVVGFVRQALRLAAFGPTLLEISDFPLRPMEKYHILLIQPGRFRFKLLDVLLICEEVATFTRGTDIQTERRVVVEERLFRHRGVVVKPTRPFEVEFDFELPQQIMHSFTSTDNQIQWKIVVQTTAKGWPQFEQAFPVVVLPPRVQDDRL